MSWPTEVPIATYNAVVADLLAQAHECFDDGSVLTEIVEFLTDSACNFIDYSQCPYYQGTGSCSYGCREEPACITGQPAGGWPTTVSLVRDET